MEIATFDFDLPGELIAQQPVEPRTASRLLVVNDASTAPDSDYHVADLLGFLRPGDLLVMNDTRVIPARLFARKKTGGRVEIFLERLLGAQSALCQIRSNSPLKQDTELVLESGDRITIGGRHERFFEISCERDLLEVFEQHGATPLPPYIDRTPDQHDKDRYQTVFARHPGAVAAPTAGLHLDDALLARIKDFGCELGFLTLHVGAGTFAPVREDNLDSHTLHLERIEVDAALCEAIIRVKSSGGRVVAIGTTVVRALEAAAMRTKQSLIEPLTDETDLFIRPGFSFQVVDALLTNFHLPKSTLLMLVCAFAGTERVMQSYASAIERRYRFYSYGDAMLLQRETMPGSER